MTEDLVLKELADIKAYTLLAAKNVLTIEDVSLITGMAKSHIYKLTHMRLIPHYKPNGKFIYFDRKEIEEWLRQGRVDTVEDTERKVREYEMRRNAR